MATAPNSRTTPASAQASPTDLAKLWEKAFKDYDNQLADCRKKPSDVRLQNVRLVQSLEDVKNSVDEKSESFTNYRHDKSALDKVRHFIGENLGYVQFIGDQAIGAATASFPPAGVIWTVATFAIKVCQTVSSDFDKLLGLLGETGSFLRSLQIIETKVPHNNIYQVCVTECLVAIVSVYAVHTKFMLQSRKAAFAHALWRGNDVDPELKDAYDNLHSAINKLTTANSMMVIRNSEDLKDLMAELKVDIRFDHDSIMSQLYTQTVAIYETKEAAEQIKTMVGQVLGLLESKKNPDMEQSETMAEEHMSVAYLRVKAFLDPPADQITRLVNIQHSFIAGTEDFVVQNPQFQEWLQRKHSYFWIHGDSGTGKSHLAYAITMELKRRFRDSKDVSVAYFLFDRNMSTAFNFRDAFRSICLQVAGQDKRYRETLASRPLENSVLADKDNSTIVDLWDFLIPDFFAKDGQSQVFLVLDSVDKSEEVKRQEVDHIVKSLLREIVDKGLHIQVLLTSDDRIWPELDGPIVNLTPAECRPATEKIIGSRLKTLPRLSQFRPRTKQQIRNSLYQINSSLLHIDRLLFSLEDLGLERLVLKTLKSPPKDIVVLFDERLARYLERRNPEERRALSILCAWITWGLKKPSLKELNAVQVMNFGRIVLDIEREVATGLSGLFAISSLPFQAQEQETLAMFLVSGRENLTINPDGSEGGESENSGQNDDLFDESLLPELDDDNKLLLSFEDPAMHSFMRGAFGYYPSFAMNVLQTSFHMFLTFVQVITSTANGSKELVDVLQRPAVEQWMAILRSMNRIDEYFIRIGLKLSLTNAEVFDVVNAIRKVTLYPETVALNIYNHPDLSDKVYREFSWNGHTAIKYWLGRALDILAADDLNTRASMGQEINGINQDTIRWATELIKKPEEYMQPFALAQLRHALSQVDQYKATNSFRLAVTAYLTKEGEIEEGRVPLDWETSKHIVESYKDQYKENPRAFRSIALAWSMKLEEEEKFMTRSLELCDSIAEGDGLDPKLEKYYSLIYLARTKYLLNKDKDGEKLINQAFTMRDAQDAEESGVAQIGFMLLSISLPDVDEQISALENAFLVCRSHWIKPLRALFTKLYRQKRYEKLVDTVNKTLYTYLITNHTWNLYYREAGKHTNRIKEVVSTYEALLQALSISRSHTSTMKFQLALTHRRFTGDVTEAKRLFYEILDADDCRDPFTEERYDWVLVKSQIEISEILWAQFREAECLQDKESFLQELSSLTDHKLAQNLTVDEVWGAYDTTLARMHMKIGPLKQFVDTLDRSFQACLMSLQDDNPWNDQETLRQLSKTLACLPGLGEDISIALSSQFYFLSGKGLHHKQPNDDHEPISQYDDSGSDTMRFDDIGDSSIQCTNPVCRNRVGIKKKEMVAFYYCLICVDTSICKACILDIQDLDGQQQSRDQLYPYCGPQHLRVSVPIQGWKGVREGIVNIQGRDPISFVEWLDNLKRKKWPEAWKRFMRQ